MCTAERVENRRILLDTAKQVNPSIERLNPDRPLKKCPEFVGSRLS
jgi:hypothetical protein